MKNADIELNKIIGKVLIENPLESRLDLVSFVIDKAAAADVLDQDEDPTWDHAYATIMSKFDTFASNYSPCWLCGDGQGQRDVEFFETRARFRDEIAKYGLSFYAHPLCEQQEREQEQMRKDS